MKPSLLVCLLLVTPVSCWAGTRTWDDRYDTSQIEVTVVYFVPSDRKPLVDWRDRVDYYCKRIEQFHQREFAGQSQLRTKVVAEPLLSERKTSQLRSGDANAIFFRTLEEADRRLEFAREQRADVFPILLVLSEINWRPLDDFYRLRPSEGGLVFEGNYNQNQHFPGATSGGARASYLADRGVGWGLVSADGWRVPYRGSDCVLYHEGCGHTVGLPHPDQGNGSVMSLGQYRGWLSESWLDKDQKSRLKWTPSDWKPDRQLELYSAFRAVPDPLVPQPGDTITLNLNWPVDAQVESLRVRFQTAIDSPWLDVPQKWEGDAPATASLGVFDRPTPISYRVEARLRDGSTAELWGYLQVRNDPNLPPLPSNLSADLITTDALDPTSSVVSVWPENEVNLLSMVTPDRQWSQGSWSLDGSTLVSPKAYGSRIELPLAPPDAYRLTLIVEPLDEPNGLLVGNCVGNHRFAALFSFDTPDGKKSAIENIDGRNVGNETTFSGSVFKKGQLSQVIVTVKQNQVRMDVDGRTIVQWQGRDDQLSLSDYWTTPNPTALFLGAYDCRYRFHRITLQPL